MISNISSTTASANAPVYPTVQNVPSPAKGTASKEDTVQLSAETQRHLTNTKASAAAPPSFDQIIREAANGDITAMAKLALVG